MLILALIFGIVAGINWLGMDVAIGGCQRLVPSVSMCKHPGAPGSRQDVDL